MVNLSNVKASTFKSVGFCSKKEGLILLKKNKKTGKDFKTQKELVDFLKVEYRNEMIKKLNTKTTKYQLVEGKNVKPVNFKVITKKDNKVKVVKGKNTKPIKFKLKPNGIQISDVKKQFMKDIFNRKYLTGYLRFDNTFYQEILNYTEKPYTLTKLSRSAEQIIWVLFKDKIEKKMGKLAKEMYWKKMKKLEDVYYYDKVRDYVDDKTLMWNRL